MGLVSSFYGNTCSVGIRCATWLSVFQQTSVARKFHFSRSKYGGTEGWRGEEEEGEGRNEEGCTELFGEERRWRKEGSRDTLGRRRLDGTGQEETGWKKGTSDVLGLSQPGLTCTHLLSSALGRALLFLPTLRCSCGSREPARSSDLPVLVRADFSSTRSYWGGEVRLGGGRGRLQGGRGGREERREGGSLGKEE